MAMTEENTVIGTLLDNKTYTKIVSLRNIDVIKCKSSRFGMNGGSKFK